MTQYAIVEEARSWLSTPYVHQASVKGAGCDCLGLVRGVWRAVYGAEPEILPAYTRDWDEVGKSEILMCAANRHLRRKPADMMQPGDVILFRMRVDAVAKHLGICSAAGSYPRFVHAYARHGVVENALSEPWARRIASVYAFPSNLN